MKVNKLYLEDCVNTMRRMPAGFVDLTVTSPPYDTLRTYNGSVKDMKAEYNGYSFDFESIARELHRVTKVGGVVVWIVGDGTQHGSETGSSFRQALFFKQLGFRIHDTMIYMKNNFSNPSTTRYHQIFEYMFVLSKGKPKTFNPIKDRKNVCAGMIGSGKNTVRQKDGTMKENPKKVNTEYGQRYNVWMCKTSRNGQEDKIAYQHPAIFPISLVRDHIISWSNPGDVVYDCFMGSGTTAKAAVQLNRKWIGSEINEDYAKICESRLRVVESS